MILNCIAVDDEPLALKLVCNFIERTPFLKLAGSYGKAVDALRGVSQQPEVDLLFLDIQMPDLRPHPPRPGRPKSPPLRRPRLPSSTSI